MKDISIFENIWYTYVIIPAFFTHFETSFVLFQAWLVGIKLPPFIKKNQTIFTCTRARNCELKHFFDIVWYVWYVWFLNVSFLDRLDFARYA